MYEFTSQSIGVRICLHDADGRLIGTAVFGGGRWATDDPAEGVALLRVLDDPDVRCHKIACVARPEPASADDQQEPDEPAGDEPAPATPADAEPAADQPAAAPRRGRPRKDN